MPVIRFTATRSLIGGVSLNDTVTYDLPVRYAGMARSRRAVKTTRASMSGRRETYVDRTEVAYDVATKPLTPTQRDALVMFLDSVEEGEEFEFAPQNSAGDSPITWLNAEIDGDGYGESRVPELDSMTTFAFRIVIVP